MKGYIIDCNYLVFVKDLMRDDYPRPRLRRPRLKIPIIAVDVGRCQ